MFKTLVAAALGLMVGFANGLAQQPAPAPHPGPPIAITVPGQAPPPAAPLATAARPAPPSSGSGSSGYQTVSPETIGHYLGIRVGDPYDPEKIRSRFQALWDVGLLENISIEAEPAAAGVTLVVTVEERPTIKTVEFSGNRKLSTSQIKDRLKEEKVEIKEGAPLSLRDIARTRSVIADYYVQQGFRSATVDFPSRTFRRPRRRSSSPSTRGTRSRSSRSLRGQLRRLRRRACGDAMKKTKVNAIWRIALGQDDVQPGELRRGRREPQGGLPRAGLQGRRREGSPPRRLRQEPRGEREARKRRVRITIPIVEGEQFFTGNFQVIKIDERGEPAEDREAPSSFRAT